MPLAKINTDTPKDMVIIWATSPAKVESQVVPTTRSVDKLTGPPMPSDQVEGKKQCILTVTASVGRLNLEATGVTSGDTMTTSVAGVAFGNPCMAATLLGLPKEKKEVSHWDAATGELTKRDLVEDRLEMCNLPKPSTREEANNCL